MFKIKNRLAPQPMQDLFKEKVNQYDLRNKKAWEGNNIRIVIYGSEKIKSWKPQGYPCRLCKTFISELGFL